MGLPSVSISNNRLEKDDLKSFVPSESEGANNGWVDFGSINTSGESFIRTENRDDHSSNCEFDGGADGESREEPKGETRGMKPTAITNSKQHASSHPTKTVLQKWDTIIRANHGAENIGNASRLYQERSVGVLKSTSYSPNSSSVRRSSGLGDVTNSLNPKWTKRSVSRDGRSDSIDVNESTLRITSRRSICDGVLNSSKPRDSTTQRRSSSISDTTSFSAHPAHTDTTSRATASKPTRERRSFGLSDFTAGLNSVPKTEKLNSPDSESSEFKKLVDLWNHQSEDEFRNFRSPSQNEKSLSRILSFGNDDGKKIVNEARKYNKGEENLLTRNLMLKSESSECQCTRSAFSGDEDLFSFFLPQMGMACVCGHNRNELVAPDNPTALENILRPWQVDFLKSLKISRGEELVKARRRDADVLAKALRKWRKKNGMVSFKTSSCQTALSIWSKVCKSYVRSVRRQSLAGREDFRLIPADAALFCEMSQFLGDLPTAPKRRERRTSDDALGIEPESQVEV